MNPIEPWLSSAPIPLSIRCPITWFLLKMFLAPTKLKIINKLQFKSHQNLPYSRSKWFLAGGMQSDGFKENGNIMDSYVINIIRLTAYENTMTLNLIVICMPFLQFIHYVWYFHLKFNIFFILNSNLTHRNSVCRWIHWIRLNLSYEQDQITK